MRLFGLTLCLAACSPAPAAPSPQSAAPDPAVGVTQVMGTSTLPDTMVTVRGIYSSGFESSTFTPCRDAVAGRGGQMWWLVEDAGFSERLAEIEATHVAERTRGTRVFVETDISGRLQRGGMFGHLGAYDAQIVVAETHDMNLLAVDPESDPVCS